ncbi:MAG: tRNA (adenosine(37)-N6)-dimethylallyltransferase MiaA [Bacteroidales bacterium]|nr:tRNA (adenosine(37)-N6)-dimethylallyltransferase MiaA [Bacteroidales bacterium]
MPRFKHSIVAELPAPEQLDLAQLARDCANGACDLVVVLGPTASGKTRYAVSLAERLGGEIISADSRQVYRGMDIGTGKDLAEYGSVPYHLIDIAEPGSQYNVWQFQQDFLRAYADIRRRGAVPILCGGTGMYINAVTRGYDFSEKTPLSAAREDISREGFPQRPFFIGTLVDRDTRNARIDARLDARLQQGMVEEIRGLLDRGVPAEALISYGLEYKFVTIYLQGELSFAEMREKLATAIHQFAKRQMTWFRGMERSGAVIHWVEV